jgi:hypothetical protein
MNRTKRLTLFATAVALTAGPLVSGPLASAAPREWDIGSYDSCMAKANDDWFDGRITGDRYDEEVRLCCSNSGGVWKAGAGDGVSGKCVAPPKDAAGNIGRIPAMTVGPTPIPHAADHVEAQPEG